MLSTPTSTTRALERAFLGRMDQSLQPTIIRLPRDLHAAVKERAAEDERTMSQTVRIAIRYYLQNTDPQHAPA